MGITRGTDYEHATSRGKGPQEAVAYREYMTILFCRNAAKCSESDECYSVTKEKIPEIIYRFYNVINPHGWRVDRIRSHYSFGFISLRDESSI